MFTNILPEETLKFVKKIKKESLPNLTYLGRGTAIALQIGHRKSQDLDFFTPAQFSENAWQQKLENEFGFELIQKDWQTLTGTVKGCKFSLFYYKYPLISEPQEFYKIKLASLEDLAAMKLDTIISRGTKRDFIDIYFLAMKFGLEKMYGFYDQKYASKWKEREIIIKKSLLYFDEAESDEMPFMTSEIGWEKIKSWFRENVQKKELGL